MFSGRALSWLTALFRRETFAHGRAGDRSKQESERIFTGAELDRIAGLMLDRYRGMSMRDILTAVSPIDILFAWAQGGSEAELDRVRAFIAEETKDTRLFLELLDALRSTVTTTEARYQVLKPESVEPFIPFEAARERLEQLAGDNTLPKIGADAKELLDSIRTGRSF
jgi:hypothetical protein